MEDDAQSSAAGIVWTIVAIAAVSLLYYIAGNEGWLEPDPYAGTQAEIEARCLNRIEAMASHRFKWTARTNWGRFNIKRDKYQPGKLGVLEGDELELMNGYGAWFKYRYRCWVNDQGDPAPELWKVKG